MLRQRRSDRPQRLGLRLSAAVLLAGAVFVLAAPHDSEGKHGELSVMLADGTLSHDNSKDGAAILTASQVWPGWSGNGEVTITNSGTAAAWLRLTEAAVNDVPGPGGGRLGNKLSLVVEDVTDPTFPVPVYTGTLGAVAERWLGQMDPSEVRTYRFRTSLPTSAGNAYQSSAVSARFDWAVSDTDPSAIPPVDPPSSDPPPDDPPPDDTPPTDPPVDEPAPDEPTPDEPTPDEPTGPAETPDTQVVPDGPTVIEVNQSQLKLRLAIPAVQRPLQTHRLVAIGSCSRRCRATFHGRLGHAGSVSRVGRRIYAGMRIRVKLRLSRQAVAHAQRALRHGHAVRGRVEMVARDRSGRTVRAVQRVKLVPVRR